MLVDSTEAIVVTAQRFATDAFETPEAVAILSQKEMARNPSRSTAEAAMRLPGVWVQKTNHGGGSPFVRGLTGNQTLLLLDGIRLNNSTYRYGPNQYFNTIDALNIHQIEAVRGAGSVLYGSDALGGAVQVFTQSPSFSDKTEIHGSLLGRLINQDMEQGGRATLSISSSKIAILGGFSARSFGELVAGGDLGIQAPSSYDEYAGDLKLKAKLGNNAILTVAYNGVFQSNVGRYDQVAQRGYELYKFDPQNREMAYAKIEFSSQSPLFQKITLTGSIQHALEGRVKRRTDTFLILINEEEDEVRTNGFSMEIQSRLGKNWTAISGFDGYFDLINSSKMETVLPGGSQMNIRGLYPDNSEASNLGLFTSHTLDWDKFKLNIGLRFNYFLLQIMDETFGDTNLEPSALVGNLSGRYALNEHHALVGSINTGFRAPNINDLSSFGSFDFGVEVPSAELSPERSLTFELGHKFKSKELETRLAVYRTQLFDLIGRIPSTFEGSTTYAGEDVYTKANISESFTQGIEFDGRWQFNPNFSAFGALTYTYGQNTSADDPMRRIPPLNGWIGLSYLKSNKWFAELELWFAAQQDRLSGGDISDHRIEANGTPGWQIVNFKVGYQLRWLQINGGIQNIFNEAYRVHGSGVDGAGRHLWLATKITF